MNGFRSHKKLKFLPTIIVLGVAILSGVVVKRAFFPADADADSFSQLEERFAEIQSTSVVRQNEYFEFLSSSESPLDAMDIDEILSLEKDDETMIFYMQEFNDRTKKTEFKTVLRY